MDDPPPALKPVTMTATGGGSAGPKRTSVRAATEAGKESSRSGRRGHRSCCSGQQHWWGGQWGAACIGQQGHGATGAVGGDSGFAFVFKDHGAPYQPTSGVGLVAASCGQAEDTPAVAPSLSSCAQPAQWVALWSTFQAAHAAISGQAEVNLPTAKSGEAEVDLSVT